MCLSLIHILFNCGTVNKKEFMDLLQLEESEFNIIQAPHKGECLDVYKRQIAGLSLFNEHALLGLGLMLSAGEIPRIAGAFGLDTSTRACLLYTSCTAYIPIPPQPLAS